MTRIRFSAEEIALLGTSLDEVADEVTATSRAREEVVGLPPAATLTALDGLMGGWERERIQLVTILTGLAEASRAAGAAYVRTEAATVASFDPGGRS